MFTHSLPLDIISVLRLIVISYKDFILHDRGAFPAGLGFGGRQTLICCAGTLRLEEDRNGLLAHPISGKGFPAKTQFVTKTDQL